ncbi:peptidase S8/S53 domain-containing protein [Pisolithus sp. B1]|nr:peptidase S8/S53 domain-containing protein [Pisolithus sp. B1]
MCCPQVWLVSFAFFSLNLVLVVSAGPTISPYVVHEKRTAIPPDWSFVRRHHGSSTLPLRFALKQRNIEKIGDFLLDVSHPDSPDYGNHWSPSDIAYKFSPSSDTIDTVREWLLSTGIGPHRIQLSPSRGWINVNASVEEAEQLMNTEYNLYKHASGTERVGCEVYHLPEHVSHHVDFVLPSVHFDARISRRGGNQPRINIGQPGNGFDGPKTSGSLQTSVTQLDQCNTVITPECLRALYGLYYDPIATEENSYGIGVYHTTSRCLPLITLGCILAEYTPQSFVQSDLQLFAKNFSTDLIGKSPALVSIDGGYYQTQYTGFNYSGEPNLDLQYGMSLVTGKQAVSLYQVGDVIEGGSFDNFLDAIDGSYCTFDGGDDPSIDAIYPDPAAGGYKGNEACGTVKPTNVVSTSYGYNEADLTPFYAARQCAEYAKLGLQGITILYCSGDEGVAGFLGVCLNPNGTQSASGTRFNPTFPATCPYITSVGATMMKPNASVDDPQPEQACEEVIYSSGGFSNYFAIPDYQVDAVGCWMDKYGKEYAVEYAGAWNSTGRSRAFPDISANGANYGIAVDGEFLLVYGTSASTPVVGALLTMVNDVRIAHGKKPIGFINPAIYSSMFAGAFKDITEGNNPGCGTNGFNATEGWHPVTGFGTPQFPLLSALWLALP